MLAVHVSTFKGNYIREMRLKAILVESRSEMLLYDNSVL